MSRGGSVASGADVLGAVKFEMGAIGAGIGVGEGERWEADSGGGGVRRTEGLPSTRALEIRAARVERSRREGFRTLKEGARVWLVGDGEDLVPLVGLGPVQFPAGGVAGRLRESPLLR